MGTNDQGMIRFTDEALWLPRCSKADFLAFCSGVGASLKPYQAQLYETIHRVEGLGGGSHSKRNRIAKPLQRICVSFLRLKIYIEELGDDRVELIRRPRESHDITKWPPFLEGQSTSYCNGEIFLRYWGILLSNSSGKVTIRYSIRYPGATAVNTFVLSSQEGSLKEHEVQKTPHFA